MLSVKGLELSYGDKKIFDRFDLEVGDGEVVCILGRSGCGKTSLLNCIAGALAHGGEVEGTERGVAYLFQETRLIPALTAAENVRFAVGHLYADRAALNAEIDRVFSSLGIDGLQNRLPGKMSGGQAARVALARALCHPSDVLLTDEPFGALDVALKLSLTEYLISALKARPRTVLMVSHGIDECFDLADRILVLGGSPCRIQYETGIGEPRGERADIAHRAQKTEEIKRALIAE